MAVTKTDLADPGPARCSRPRSCCPGAEVVAVSARTGAGLDELRAALDRARRRTSPGRGATQAAPARLHIDRVFTIRGAGTVVTGTLWSGAIARGDELQLLPGGRRLRVRGVQVHDAVGRAGRAGQRVAVNLDGSPSARLARGDVLAVVEGGARRRRSCSTASSRSSDGDRRARRPRPGPPRHARDAGAAGLAGRPLLAAAARAPAVAARRRPAGRPPDRAAGHARRRRVLDAHPRKHGPGRSSRPSWSAVPRGGRAGPSTQRRPRAPAAPPAPAREPRGPLSPERARARAASARRGLRAAARFRARPAQTRRAACGRPRGPGSGAPPLPSRRLAELRAS